MGTATTTKIDGDDDALPELAGGENIDVIVEADKSGDALPHHIGREAEAEHRKQRQESEGEDPDHRGEKQRVFERAAVFQSFDPLARHLISSPDSNPPNIGARPGFAGAGLSRGLRRTTPGTAPSACRGRSGR